MDKRLISALSCSALALAISACDSSDNNPGQQVTPAPYTGTSGALPAGLPQVNADAPAQTLAARSGVATEFAQNINGTAGSILASESMIEQFGQSLQADLESLNAGDEQSLYAMALVLQDSVGMQMAAQIETMLGGTQAEPSIDFSAGAGTFSLDDATGADFNINYGNNAKYSFIDGGDTAQWTASIDAIVSKQCGEFDPCTSFEESVTIQWDASISKTAFDLAVAVEANDRSYVIEDIVAQVSYLNMEAGNLSVDSAGASLQLGFLDTVDDIKLIDFALNQTQVRLNTLTIEGSAAFKLVGGPNGISNGDSQSTANADGGSLYTYSTELDVDYDVEFAGLVRTSGGGELLASVKANGSVYEFRDEKNTYSADGSYITNEVYKDKLVSTITASTELKVGANRLKVTAESKLDVKSHGTYNYSNSQGYDSNYTEQFKMLAGLTVQHNNNIVKLGMGADSAAGDTFLIWQETPKGDLVALELGDQFGNWQGAERQIGRIIVNGEVVAPVVLNDETGVVYADMAEPVEIINFATELLALDFTNVTVDSDGTLVIDQPL